MRLPLWNDSAENREDSNNQEEKVDKNVKKNP